jgi:uncharacterized protein (DUF488 family)
MAARGRVILLTIGYEGRSLQEYLGLLGAAGCTLLCDVRRNAFSHKPGFSKKALAAGCAGAGIRYEHVPALGIASADRKGVETPADVAALFARYRREMLPQHDAEIARIAGWIHGGEIVALTCYERDTIQCHRHVLAEALGADPAICVQNL